MAQDSTLFISSGVPGLDTVLGGGLRSGRIYFVEGESGTGKTTLALQFVLEGVRRGERSLVVSLSETTTELATAASSHGWSLDGVEMRDLTDTGAGGGAPLLFHLSETALDDRVEALLDAVDKVRPQRMVLDTLSSLRTLSEQPGRLRRHLEMIQRRVDAVGCTLLVVDELFGGDLLHPRSLAWGILRLEQHVGDFGPERRRLFLPKLRGQPYEGGYHDFRIHTGGLEVFPSLRGVQPSADFTREPLSTGIAELDALLGGGLMRGTSTAALGPPGSGKSTLVCQLAMAMAGRGERVAVFLFDESVETFRLRARSQGLDLDRALAGGDLILRRIDPAELSPGELAHTLRRLVEDGGVRFVAVDSLNGYLYAMPDQRFMHLHVHQLLTYLSARGTTTLLTMTQPGPFSGSERVPVDLSYLADTVIAQRFFEAGGSVRLAVSVVKKRYGDHERTIREYRIGAQGLILGEPLSRFRGVLTGVPEYVGDIGPLM
jgi:circadian clock protein KaiC